MNHPVKTLVSIRYYRDGKPWDTALIRNPGWAEIEEAICRMDDDCFPIVVQSSLEYESDEEAFEDDSSFHIIGGNGRFAIFQNTGAWQYSNKSGSAEPVRLWQSDQGYFCEEHNIADLAMTLRLAKIFYETSSFEAVEAASGPAP
jgi:hypothetical protein